MLKATEWGKLKNHTDTTTAQAAIVMDDKQATLYMIYRLQKKKLGNRTECYYLPPTIHFVYPPDLFYISNRSNWFNNYLQCPIPQK